MTRSLTLAFLPLLTLFTLASQLKSVQVQSPSDSKQPASGKASSDLAPSQIFKRARPAVVVIVADDQNSQREALGSGFLVTRDQIATNDHVVNGMKEAYVLFLDGAIKRVSGVVADSVQPDLIILRVETGNRPSLPFGDELSLQQGDPVYALGAPKGLELSFTNGIVSSFRKSDSQFLIQTTAPIAPGSSGGPLFDRAGRVVGITTSMLTDAPGIYFSVGVGDLSRLLRTPQGVALSFDDWAKQQERKPPSEPINNGGSNQELSLRETISWMQNFLQYSGLRFFNGKPSVRDVLLSDPQHEKASAPGCAVRIMKDNYQFENGSVTARVEFFDLSDIDPDSVKVAENGVLFGTADASAKIHNIETSDATMSSAKLFSSEGQANSDTKEVYSDPIGSVGLDSPESSKRFTSALKHAVILCGGVKSPF
jgi:Trypsin-like peptidase domain